MKRGASEQFVLEEADVNRFWNTCHKLEDKVLVGLCMMEGLRISEAIHLRSSWIRQSSEIAKIEISIPGQQECDCNDCIDKGYWSPKSQASIRVIPVVMILSPHLLQFLNYQPYGLGFTRQTGWHRIKSLAEKAGIAYLSPHILRATAATNFAKGGLTAAELCVTMGWARIEMGAHYIQMAQARSGARDKIMKMYQRA